MPFTWLDHHYRVNIESDYLAINLDFGGTLLAHVVLAVRMMVENLFFRHGGEHAAKSDLHGRTVPAATDPGSLTALAAIGPHSVPKSCLYNS